MEVKDWIMLAVVAVTLFVWWFLSRKSSVQGKKVGSGYAKVVALLEKAGYEVQKAKPRITVNMDIDGKAHPFDLTCDLLAKKHGLIYLVRIRRDAKPVRLHSKLWRGSLLRDVLAFKAAGFVIVNTEKETLQEVRFRI